MISERHSGASAASAMCSRKQELHSSRFLSVQKALHLEVTRKLKLAAVTEGKEGREIICSEIFADVTGELDKRAKACLKTPEHLYFYEILSLFYCNYQSEADLFVQLSCSLWGQPYVAPVFALLLHKRLLLTEEAETASDQLKHVNVLVQGTPPTFHASSIFCRLSQRGLHPCMYSCLYGCLCNMPRVPVCPKVQDISSGETCMQTATILPQCTSFCLLSSQWMQIINACSDNQWKPVSPLYP
mmetsp:Transcript_23171/g.59366  ORF Transcript_23171/g.59366 Transcript_23171/m.59366 type:complete len:243 (-) Transcript_23171:818-1546(-)